MSNRYKQSTHFSGVTRFTQSPMAEVEFSRMTSPLRVLTDMNAGDVVPVLCLETLPHDTFEIDFDYINRLLSASIVPTMGEMQYDLFAFHVPNRVVNESWKNVTGENSSGFWAAPEISLAPLMDSLTGSTQIPVGSVADYYDLPTQAPIPNVVLAQMNDLVFRGYLSCWNEYFRDQNYMAPIPFSKLNVFNGFLKPAGSPVNIVPGGAVQSGTVSDGSYEQGGAVVKALYGEGSSANGDLSLSNRITSFSALDKPLKACKLHDAFTSVLPSPQKGPDVTFTTSGVLPVVFDFDDTATAFENASIGLKYHISEKLGTNATYWYPLTMSGSGRSASIQANDTGGSDVGGQSIDGWNVTGTVDLANAVGITINDLRTAIATQQVLELLARGGSRYWSFLKTFFNIEADNPFPDIPTQIGHFRSNLDMYQVAQTSSTTETSPQASLAAFGYSTSGAGLFTKTFLEHGFIHIFAVIRHKSIYPTYVPPHLFRRNTLDFYLPQLANIGEQPIRLATLNPFLEDSLERAIGYQEAWYEYRYDVDRVRGALRSGVGNSLDVWHYGNYYDPDFTHVNGEWLISDSQEILDRTLRVTSDEAPQFINQINFKITKQRPMPVYSVPGLDTI